MASTTSPTVASALPVETRHVAIRRWTLGKILIWIAVIIVTFIALFPFLYALTTSFKQQRASYDGTMIPWLQYEPTLANWQAEFGSGGPETFKALKNSALIAVGATLLATTLGTAAGWGLARFK